jgi:aspartyl-tRNA(Asn)/glutamyl-tRNA(Gln) amidotransferase subunit A
VSDELTWMSACSIRDLIATGDVSATEVTEHFLGRLEEHDATLHTFTDLDRDGAVEQAKAADAARSHGEKLGRLHGVPVSIKEHMRVKGFATLGALDRADPVSKYDELGVARLREAGAIVFGTNSMMASGLDLTKMTNDNGVFGGFNWDVEARNPWDPSRAPGWSSSGGAAAVAAGLIPLAVGTDGGGSTRLPAAYCGVVGLHPTPNLIPWISYDVPKPSPMMMTMGPLARDARDAATMLAAMAGPDGRDFSCQQLEPPDYLADIDAGVAGWSFAWTDDYGFTDMYAQEESPRVIATVREVALGFTAIGATVHAADIDLDDFFPGFLASTYLYPTGGGMPSPPPADDWNGALATRQKNWLALRAVLDDHDLILSVTSQILPRPIEEWAAAWTTSGPQFTPHHSFAPVYTSHTHMFNWLGFPAVSVPVGFVDGLPVGLQIIGKPGNEQGVLRAAHAFLTAFPRTERPPVS